MFSKLSLPFAATVLVLWLGLGSWWYGANYCGAHASLGGVPGLSLMDGNYEITATETFSFYKSGADPNIPSSTEEAFKTLATHLKDEPDRQLTLFGIYSPNESNGTGFENLGQARASAIRDYLMDLGVPKKKLKVKGGSFGNASFANGLMYGGVYFRFQNVNERPNTPIVGEESRSKDLFQPVNIYFDVNEYDLILTDDLEAYLKDIKSFLQKNSNAQISITGHTDNRGSGDANLSLSETRARNVKKFMIRSGFDPKRLVIEYRGEEAPLNANKSEESKKKNRRVELRLRTK
ncbi:MAG: OOP family OmpA-OmpF porin [Polaribacter sp.]|jgi:OOP family OmpA-OmpF porin